MFHRALILTLGPIAIVGACYWLTMSHSGQGLAAAPVASSPSGANSKTDTNALATDADLRALCRQSADQLERRLDASCRLIVRPPYVLAGDLPEETLDRHFRETIVPTAQALRTCYFDRRPDRPITILLFSGDRSYRRHADRLDGNQRNGYYGYYQRSDHRIVLNIATGNGTLAHELTHALAHFDFPTMPEWFDEGLASLHEQSEFSDDGLTLLGRSNWRIYYLVQAIQRDQLGSLESMLAAGKVRANREAVDYAAARYLCLYLQQRGLLGHFYRKFRATAVQDPTGRRALRAVLHLDSLDALDGEFRQWVLALFRNEHAS